MGAFDTLPATGCDLSPAPRTPQRTQALARQGRRLKAAGLHGVHQVARARGFRVVLHLGRGGVVRSGGAALGGETWRGLEKGRGTRQEAGQGGGTVPLHSSSSSYTARTSATPESRLTAADCTPGTAASAASTAEEQEEQVMPCTCSSCWHESTGPSTAGRGRVAAVAGWPGSARADT